MRAGWDARKQAIATRKGRPRPADSRLVERWQARVKWWEADASFKADQSRGDSNLSMILASSGQRPDMELEEAIPESPFVGCQELEKRTPP